MAVRVTAVPRRQLTPGGRLRMDGLEDVGVLDFTVCECKKSLVSVWKAGGNGYIADSQRNA